MQADLFVVDLSVFIMVSLDYEPRRSDSQSEDAETREYGCDCRSPHRLVIRLILKFH